MYPLQSGFLRQQMSANRAGVELIAGQEGGDPAAVVFDAVNAAKARNADILICDTAGRLHNKKNLMEELKKINRIIDKEMPEAYRENLIVLDGTTGQNALAQAKQFSQVADITGIILTKLDGTAKGGIAIAIQSEMNRLSKIPTPTPITRIRNSLSIICHEQLPAEI